MSETVLYGIHEVVEKTGIGLSTLRRWKRRGWLSIRWGLTSQIDPTISPRRRRRCWIFTPEDIEKVRQIRLERRRATIAGTQRFWRAVKAGRRERRLGAKKVSRSDTFFCGVETLKSLFINNLKDD